MLCSYQISLSALNSTQSNLLTRRLVLDPRSPPPRIRQNLQAQENRTARIWRIEVFELCEGSGREGIFDRGAEDREEGAEGEPGEEALRGCIRSIGFTVGNMMATIA